jgi:crotonobetainyl-CoA:carnitine CoA-transferase CaiB-like acyl-CoA transferase
MCAGRRWVIAARSNKSSPCVSKSTQASIGSRFSTLPTSGARRFSIGRSFVASQAFEQLAMIQTLKDEGGIQILTTRLPIRLDASLLTSERLAPRVGQHTDTIQRQFGI